MLKSFYPFGAVLLFLCGCGGSINNLPITGATKEFPCCGAENKQPISVQYLGVGGFLIRRGVHAVLTAPFYSNPGMIRVGCFLPIAANTERIEKLLPPVTGVDAILVAHSHYDHLLDIPYIAEHRARQAKIYGSKTMTHILAGANQIAKDRLVALNSKAAHFKSPGEWIWVADRTIRFMALESEHAPHFLGIKFFKGKIDQDLQHLPRTAWGFKEGQTFAFVIDFMGNDGAIDFRIYYQDAASNPPYGFPPDFNNEDVKAVDLAILCVASFSEIKNYPEGIIMNTSPHHVILGHWENFFRSPTKPFKVVPFSNAGEFIARLKSALPEKADWTMPQPLTVLQ